MDYGGQAARSQNASVRDDHDPQAPLWAMVVGAVIVLGWLFLVSWLGP